MVYTAYTQNTLPVPAEPGVLSIHVVSPSSTNDDRAVSIPWKNCTLTYAYTVTTIAEDGTNAVYLDLELNAASGSAMGTITVAQSAPVGDIDEIGTLTRANCIALDRDDAARDAINIEATSAGANTWEGTLFLYFERDVGY
jgi:hypothetical protein